MLMMYRDSNESDIELIEPFHMHVYGNSLMFTYHGESNQVIKRHVEFESKEVAFNMLEQIATWTLKGHLVFLDKPNMSKDIIIYQQP